MLYYININILEFPLFGQKIPIMLAYPLYVLWLPDS